MGGEKRERYGREREWKGEINGRREEREVW
jgi:hypothetical protein